MSTLITLPTGPISESEAVELRLRLSWKLAATDVGDYLTLPPEFVAEQGRAVQLIDVREEDELTGILGYVPGSSWIALAEIERLAEELPSDAPLVLICDDGKRSARAAQRLQAQGMTWVAVMAGGVRAWKDRGFATTRDEIVFEPRVVSAERAPAQSRRGALSLGEIRAHIGDPRTVRWVKLASLSLHGKTSCIDGRDEHGVIGAPGGDAGEFLLTMASVEQLTGRSLAAASLPSLLTRWAESFGHFYYHTDLHALAALRDKILADPRVSMSQLPLRSEPTSKWKHFVRSPPQELREVVLDHLLAPETIGCGHLRFMLTRSAEYGLRKELVLDFFRAILIAGWDGLSELRPVVLLGGHREGAVVTVRLDELMQPYTAVPLISPRVGDMQVFVNHPDVTAYTRQMYAHFVCQHLDLGLTPNDAPRLFETMNELGDRHAALTVGALAAGLPQFTVRFDRDRNFSVALACSSPRTFAPAASSPTPGASRATSSSPAC